MSLYAQYLAERTSDGILEFEQGFVTYRYLNPKQVYIIDIYVVPEFRKQGWSKKFCDLVVEKAKEKGCTELIGTCAYNKPWTTQNLLAAFAYGMEISTASHEAIILRKDI